MLISQAGGNTGSNQEIKEILGSKKKKSNNGLMIKLGSLNTSQVLVVQLRAIKTVLFTYPSYIFINQSIFKTYLARL